MAQTERKNVGHVTSTKVESLIVRDHKLHLSMKNLLVSQNETMEDKIATVKTAQLIDKGQFEIAFKTLMKR